MNRWVFLAAKMLRRPMAMLIVVLLVSVACSPNEVAESSVDTVDSVELAASHSDADSSAVAVIAIEQLANKIRADVTTDRFALLALSCIHREFPNKISHVMQSMDDVRAPHQLTPAFYGCYDWHSAVHGHWMLARLLNTDASLPLREDIIAALSSSFTESNLQRELAYYTQAGRASFERPYGIAWYLQLVAELEQSTLPEMRAWRKVLQPLEQAIVVQIKNWLPKLVYPVRLGTHNQTAFAFGLMLDYSRIVNDVQLEAMLVEKSHTFHNEDRDCPMAYEPSGEDFLSPCLMEADLMRRVLNQQDFARWLSQFLPNIPSNDEERWLEPGVVLDASDGKLMHLDGVNLSRAWALQGIAHALPDGDARGPALMSSAQLHQESGIAAVSDAHYSGSHWLASFATYLLTQRGLAEQ